MAHVKFELGPTGDYPDGKLCPSDEGELTLAIGVANGRVVMEFGKAVKWIGLTPKDARALMALLGDKVDHLDPITFDGNPTTLPKVLIGQFDQYAAEVHAKALRADDVVHTAVYAAMEQVWQKAIKEVEVLFCDELEDDRVDIGEDDEDEWQYGDAIDFDNVEIDEEPETDPETLDQRMKQAADGIEQG